MPARSAYLANDNSPITAIPSRAPKKFEAIMRNSTALRAWLRLETAAVVTYSSGGWLDGVAAASNDVARLTLAHD